MVNFKFSVPMASQKAKKSSASLTTSMTFWTRTQCGKFRRQLNREAAKRPTQTPDKRTRPSLEMATKSNFHTKLESNHIFELLEK